MAPAPAAAVDDDVLQAIDDNQSLTTRSVALNAEATETVSKEDDAPTETAQMQNTDFNNETASYRLS